MWRGRETIVGVGAAVSRAACGDECRGRGALACVVRWDRLEALSEPAVAAVRPLLLRFAAHQPPFCWILVCAFSSVWLASITRHLCQIKKRCLLKMCSTRRRGRTASAPSAAAVVALV